MFNPSREQVRRFFFDAWQRYREGLPLEGAALTAIEVILLHPETHAVLEDPSRNLDRDWGPEGGVSNPFLHLSLHLAIEEQLAIGQPPGIREAFDALERRLRDGHEARHALLECLGETLWLSQREGRPLDAEGYVGCVRRRAALA